jgi:hypothetical protein
MRANAQAAGTMGTAQASGKMFNNMFGSGGGGQGGGMTLGNMGQQGTSNNSGFVQSEGSGSGVGLNANNYSLY